MSPASANVHIGTSGWNYRHWRERFYPKGTALKHWLEHFAQHFDTVEVNNAFYRVPSSTTISRWRTQTPSRFRFAVKMWRGITHFKKLKPCDEHLETFFASLEPLPTTRAGPILVQLPSNQGKDVDKLSRFLDDVKRITHPRRWKLALEFRHDGWYDDDVYALLDAHRAAVCLHDMGGGPNAQANNASFVYLRRHGPHGDYTGSYDDRAIAGDADRIATWLDEGRTTFVYYNNDAEALAVHDAKRLQDALAVRRGA